MSGIPTGQEFCDQPLHDWLDGPVTAEELQWWKDMVEHQSGGPEPSALGPLLTGGQDYSIPAQVTEDTSSTDMMDDLIDYSAFDGVDALGQSSQDAQQSAPASEPSVPAPEPCLSDPDMTGGQDYMPARGIEGTSFTNQVNHALLNTDLYSTDGGDAPVTSTMGGHNFFLPAQGLEATQDPPIFANYPDLSLVQRALEAPVPVNYPAPANDSAPANYITPESSADSADEGHGVDQINTNTTNGRGSQPPWPVYTEVERTANYPNISVPLGLPAAHLASLEWVGAMVIYGGQAYRAGYRKAAAEFAMQSLECTENLDGTTTLSVFGFPLKRTADRKELGRARALFRRKAEEATRTSINNKSVDKEVAALAEGANRTWPGLLGGPGLREEVEAVVLEESTERAKLRRKQRREEQAAERAARRRRTVQ
ncbi:hypothetical protein ACRE_070370 [Hapsidospora chrysogenum ATCC 11550]|uniref:Uncharacterized protein n=1 Tax=Hapsidospora chrysogenum (strain ATCC 11550 / CBS 779.69 / DSM 880 / IAM 14645 / JCM 23072 / IMI 49137) TaxID=857340 RepID=A0A086SYR3_HAPC1|nr:hypothetical protein ACRE_070370 [Hapsidospora chrysogenum ATCC 11550]